VDENPGSLEQLDAHSPVSDTRQPAEAPPCENLILAAVPSKERQLLFDKLESVKFANGQVLQQPNRTIEFGYFLNQGLGSVLAVMHDNTSVEVGLIGNEGFVGGAIVAGFRSTPHRIIIQAPGSGFRISAGDLRSLLVRCPTLHGLLERYAQLLAIQSGQTAACNAVHRTKQRLARWLLMSHDSLRTKELALTHEFLSYMLATTRPSMTLAAQTLKRAGLIEYTRGLVTILDRKGLEEAACECYEVVRQQFGRQ
jgi:CRP-like cAMP-binding protein